MIFLICIVLVGAKLVHYCRRCGKDLDDNREELTWAEIKTKVWFKILLGLRMILMFASLIAFLYYTLRARQEVDKWANEAVDSWDIHFQSFFSLQSDINVTMLPNCTTRFRSNLSDNIQYVQNYTFGLSDNCLKNLSLDDEGITALLKNVGSKYPVFITALSNRTYLDGIGLIENVQTVLYGMFPKVKIRFNIFDSGLLDHQRSKILDYSFCSVLKIPTEKLNPCLFGKNKTIVNNITESIKYPIDVIKPALIQTELQNSDFVMWVDPNVRFNTSSLFKRLVKNVKGKSLQVPQVDHSPLNTSIDVLSDMLGEKPCLFGKPAGLDTNIVLLKRNNFTLNAVMRPWVSMTFKVANQIQNQPRTKSKTRKCFNNKMDFKRTILDKFHGKLDSSVLELILTQLFINGKELFSFKLDSFAWQNPAFIHS